MPKVIVQRYESGHFARNHEADMLYEEAVQRANEQQYSSSSSSSHHYKTLPFATTTGYPVHQHVPQPMYGMPTPSYGSPYSSPSMPYQQPMYQAPPSHSSPPSHHQGAGDHHHQQQQQQQRTESPELGSRERPLYTQQVTSFFGKMAGGLSLAVTCAFGYLLWGHFYGDDKDGNNGLNGITPGTGKVHREADVSQTTVRFSDVKGCDEAKHELQEIVQFLRDPEKFTKLGAKLPRGVLLVGPPGTGKTLLAKAIAGESGVPFFFASGSEFDEMYVGVGASRIKKLFAQARKKSPCIVFIDELDAIGGRRSVRDSSHSRQAINQLLVELDGFDANDKVIIIGATNLASVLDRALLRPGRFDRHVEVPLPDIKGRKEILELYGKKVPLASDANLLQLARGTPGNSGADLFNLINSAALRAAALNAKQVTTDHLEWARDKILMGAERKSSLMTEESRKCTAYHEGGHAIMAIKTKGADPIHKATIMPRGNALGVTHQLPEGDQTSRSRQQMFARMDVLMGGRVAEELIYGPEHVTSGASNDLMQATNLAREMVLRYGMGNRTGYASISEEDLPKQSEETRQLVDAEVKDMLDSSYARAKMMLKTNESGLHRLASALLKNETLDAKEITTVVNGGTIDDSRWAKIELEEREKRAAEREQAERDKFWKSPTHTTPSPTPSSTPIPTPTGVAVPINNGPTPSPTPSKPPVGVVTPTNGGSNGIGAAAGAASTSANKSTSVPPSQSR